MGLRADRFGIEEGVGRDLGGKELREEAGSSEVRLPAYSSVVMLCAVMLPTVSRASQRHVEGLPCQVGMAKMSHSRPGRAATRERGAQPQFCTDGARQRRAPCSTLRQARFILPAGASTTWGWGVLGLPRERVKLKTPGKDLQEK